MEQREGRSPTAEDPGDEQINSRQRVRDLAEVYTHKREVHAMLDLLPNMFPSAEDPGNTDRSFLEPACGSGNFLVAILGRKLGSVTPRNFGRGEGFEHRALRCLASIYGIDICEQNVATARQRMSDLICAHVAHHLGANSPSPAFVSAVKTILATNIIRADTVVDAAEIELVEYTPASDGTFIREWSHPLDPAAGSPTLFSLTEPRRDAAPVHYAELECRPGPVAAALVDQEAA
jgi:hypothetical protein